MLQVTCTRVMDKISIRATCMHHGDSKNSHEILQTFMELGDGAPLGRTVQLVCALELAVAALDRDPWAHDGSCETD